MRKVQIEVREVYGTPHAYPVNVNAKLFAKIARTKTLPVQHLAAIKELGFEIEEIRTPRISIGA